MNNCTSTLHQQPMRIAPNSLLRQHSTSHTQSFPFLLFNQPLPSLCHIWDTPHSQIHTSCKNTQSPVCLIHTTLLHITNSHIFHPTSLPIMARHTYHYVPSPPSYYGSLILCRPPRPSDHHVALCQFDEVLKYFVLWSLHPPPPTHLPN